MARLDLERSNLAKSGIGAITRQSIPTQNPCAQCGKPIPAPDWIEPGQGRVSYLWKCHACGYRFEAIAIFDQTEQALAA